MKQHITVEQLNELGDKAIEQILIKEWGKLTAFQYAKDAICKRFFNVGKMIELIYQNKPPEYSFKMFDDISNSTNGFWYVSIKKEGGYYIEDTNGWHEKELVDALWQACKCILEDEN